MTEKLTRDECTKALNALYFSDGTDGRDDEFYNVLMELINEHFDNLPLKFEELEESKDYYHFEYGWMRILNIHDCDCIVIVSLDCPGYFSIEFEEGMFYRKQVEE